MLHTMPQSSDKRPVAGLAAPQPKQARIGVLVVAYNADTTLAKVLDRIPADFRKKIAKVYVCDDHSQDSTYRVGLDYRLTSDLPMVVIRHPRNLGYGGNQKAGYRLVIDGHLDIIVLLHGDGQYAPECIADLVSPLERGECDAVFGSRMMTKGGARKGGMPLYKFAGNRILTKFENRALGMRLSEFHSGYRAYRVQALAEIPFETNSDGFNFDTQIIIQLHDAGKRIMEVPIPTYYGDEISYVNGIKYAKDIFVDVLRYRLQKRGFASGDLGNVGHEYTFKPGETSSHWRILNQLRRLPPSRILDLGVSGGRLGRLAREYGHEVTGVDVVEPPGVRDRLDNFFVADLDLGIPADVGSGYDVVVAADVLEHVRKPEELLVQIRSLLSPKGVVIASIPNFGHWYSRGRTALGLFDYDQRGILDRGHVRFFTRRSFHRLVATAGLSVVRTEYVGLPLDVLAQKQRVVARGVRTMEAMLVALRPTMFAYQIIFRLEAQRPGVVLGVPRNQKTEFPA